MYKSILFFLLMIFLNTGFVEDSAPIENEGGKQRQFLEFLSYFEKVSLPYSLDLQSVECGEFAKSNQPNLLKEDAKFIKIAGPFIPFSRAAKFSRMGRPLIYPMARFFPDDQTVAVIYKGRMTFGSPYTNDYYLAYFDLKGNLLGKSKKGHQRNNRQIGFTNLHHTQVFTIFPSGRIETVFYDNDWEAKVGSIAMEKNKLLGFKKVKSVNYELAGARGIREVSQTLATTRP